MISIGADKVMRVWDMLTGQQAVALDVPFASLNNWHLTRGGQSLMFLEARNSIAFWHAPGYKHGFPD